MNEITIGFFEGSNYYEVFLNGEKVHDCQTKYEANMFAAELGDRLKHKPTSSPVHLTVGGIGVVTI
jgi:hypothetical protein